MKNSIICRLCRKTGLLILLSIGFYPFMYSQGFSPAVQSRLQFVIDSFQNNPANPFVGGMSATINVDGLAIWQGSTGYSARNVGAANNLLPGGSPFAININSRIYSITKTFTAPLVLELAREGYFSLEDPVSNFMPLAVINPGLNGSVTIRQLLGHESGYSDYQFEYMIQVYVAFEPTHVWTPYETLTFIHQIAVPGAERRYSSTNYIMLGAIVEAVTGKPMEQHYRERFFNPLGLTSMYLGQRENGAGYGTLVAPHDNISMFNPIFMMTGQPTFPDAYTNISQFPLTAVVSLAFSGGGIVGNSGDVAKWGNALFGGRATSAATLQAMLNSISSTPDEDGDYLGYGLYTNKKISTTDYFVGHYGNAPGYKAVMMYQPDRKMTIAIVCNYSGSSLYTVAKKLYESLPNFLCGNGNNSTSKILICFKGKDLCIARNAVPSHIKNGAYLGSCGQLPGNAAKGIVSEVPAVTYERDFSVFPNPAEGQAVITFKTPADGMVKLQMYDMNGNLVKELFNGTMEKGIYKQLYLQTGGFPAGLYICKLQTVAGVSQHKLIIGK